MSDFDPKPRFPDHMCHWKPWADNFQTSDSPDTATLALMLGYACGEIERLRRIGAKQSTWSGALQFAYVMTCETGKEVPVSNGTLPYGEALDYIQVLNRWRKENKFGDLEP